MLHAWYIYQHLPQNHPVMLVYIPYMEHMASKIMAGEDNLVHPSAPRLAQRLQETLGTRLLEIPWGFTLW